MSWCGGGEMRPTPGVEWRTLAMTLSTLWPGNWPPSPGLAPCAILICIASELTRYSAVTPKRPEATCLIAERIESPFGSGLKRSDSSPPSPVFDLPPMRFIAIASVVCASREIEPNDIAPVENRRTMFFAGSTSSSGTGLRPSSSAVFRRKRPRMVTSRSDCSFTIFEQPLVDRLDVALDDLFLVELLRQLVLDRDQRLEGEIGIDRLRAVAGEAGEVVHLARLARLDHQADRGAQALADEMMVHRRAGE